MEFLCEFDVYVCIITGKVSSYWINQVFKYNFQSGKESVTDNFSELWN